MPDRKGRRLRRFDTYARLEAANVVLVPAFALWLAWPRDKFEAAAMALAIAACSGFLIIGALYWWAVHQRLRMTGASSVRALATADRAEKPLLALTVGAIGAAAFLFGRDGFSACAIAAAGLTFLAMLEYVNYYSVQLQYFDNLRDFRRLLTTRRLRRSHMARDLAEYRRGRG